MHLLQVCISNHCFGCEEAIHLAREVSKKFPALSVEIVDLDKRDAVKPDQVFAVPTFVLDGQLLALGNPELGQIERWILKAMMEERAEA